MAVVMISCLYGPNWPLEWCVYGTDQLLVWPKQTAGMVCLWHWSAVGMAHTDHWNGVFMALVSCWYGPHWLLEWCDCYRAVKHQQGQSWPLFSPHWTARSVLTVSGRLGWDGGGYWHLNDPGNQVVGLGSGNELPKKNIYWNSKNQHKGEQQGKNVYIKTVAYLCPL